MFDAKQAILVVAAGTGGHVLPALALAEELRAVGMNPVFVGRPGSLEQELATKAGLEFQPLASSGFFGKGVKARVAFALNTLRGWAQILGIMRRVRPVGVVAAGGFGSLLPALGARLFQRPFFMLEQNRIPGRATRYLSRGARELYLTFPLLRSLRGRSRVTGTPLRRTLLGRNRQDDGRTLLVLGGSLGARALNLQALELARELAHLKVVVQTGRRDFVEMQQRVQAAGLGNVELVDFTLAIDELYSRASLVLSRAGGMVINEILAFGLPSILVPFPFATDNHQKANAQHIARKGAALQIDQARLPETASIIRQLFERPTELATMAARARELARRDAARTIARRIAAIVAPKGVPEPEACAAR
jgi:UDP-N-acetylglucosamine--N-acetylmuramyl-(pentapeptide) pyrophosphoryl-undecaprenol N-acetylglucosamine transferase